MKICILTLPLQTNYGGILQAIAVQKVMRRLGHQPITLDTPWPEPKALPWYKEINHFIETFVSFCRGRKTYSEIYRPFSTRKRNMIAIRKKMRDYYSRVIDLSPRITSDETIKSYCQLQRFDAYVVGSDQVWRPCYSPNINWYYLSFLSDESQAKRIAFSASFGTNDWEYSEEQTATLKPLAQKFDAISVREKSGVDLCKQYFNVAATHTLDPTMLLTPQDYAELIALDKDETYSVEHKLFSYLLDGSDFKKEVLDFFSSQLSLPVESLKTYPALGAYDSVEKALGKSPRPVAQWLRSFQECDFVVTDSFHGTVFSILHHRPFVVLGNKDRGLARMETLLETFGLTQRMVTIGDRDNLTTILNSTIDWEKVDAILQTKREEAMKFLSEALE